MYPHNDEHIHRCCEGKGCHLKLQKVNFKENTSLKMMSRPFTITKYLRPPPDDPGPVGPMGPGTPETQDLLVNRIS